MSDVLISLGANLGNTRLSINTAASMLRERFGQSKIRLSSLLKTPPIGGPDGQSEFLNAVACIQTEKTVFQVWHELRQIEAALGRQRRQRWEARRIDLDILMQDSLRIWTPHLKVPHPRMVTRSFATLPAAELLPETIEPVSGLALQTLAARMPYQYDASIGKLEFDGALLAGLPSDIVVLCVSKDLASQMQSVFERSNQISDDPTKRIEKESVETSLRGFQTHFTSLDYDAKQATDFKRVSCHLEDFNVALLVVAIVCPDPTVVAWEDFARPWANLLGMNTPSESNRYSNNEVLPRLITDWQFPKYLINAYDLDWAVHELNAAIVSMRCEMSFAQPGFDSFIDQ